MGQAEFTFGPVGLSREEEIVLDLIKAHQGRAAAISLPALALRTGIDERRVQSIINELITRHGQPIGSASTKPAGLYWITTADEREEALKHLEHRWKSILRRWWRLRGCSIDEVLGQIKLEFSEERDERERREMRERV